MPYPSYMDQLGAWPGSPNPINGQPDPSFNGPYSADDYAEALGTKKPPAVTGTTDPNAALSSQAILDMVRRKGQDYNGGPGSQLAMTSNPVGSYADTPSTDMSDDAIAARSRAYGDDARSAGGTGPVAGPGVAVENPDITNQITATSAVAGLGQSPTNSINQPIQVPTNQNTVIGNSIYDRNLTPDARNNILQQTQDDPRFAPRTSTGRNETTGQDFTMTPGRRIPLAVAQSIAAKQQLDNLLRDSNNQAQLDTDRKAQLLGVPGQNAVNLQQVRNQGAQALQGQQNDMETKRMAMQQQQWNDQRPMREAQVNLYSKQAGMADADTKMRLAEIENMDTPQARTARAAMQYATALDPTDPSKGDIFLQALNSLGGGAPGAAQTGGIAQAVGQANNYAADRNTAEYMARDPEYAATVKALKGAKPGIGTAIMSGIAKAGQQDFGTSFGARGVKEGNEGKWVDAVQKTQEHFNTIAARKHLNAKQLMDGAMKQAQ